MRMISMMRKRSHVFVAFDASIILLDDVDIGAGSPRIIRVEKIEIMVVVILVGVDDGGIGGGERR